MVDVVRCDRQVTRPTCSTEGCTRPAIKRGRCGTCYQRWYDSPDFVLAPAPPPYVPPPPPYVPPPDPVCPWCGPYKPSPGAAGIICQTCGMDAGEHAYIDCILADSSAVYAEEHRAFQAQRTKGR